jgi:transposase
MKIEIRRVAGLVRVSRNGKRFFSEEHKRAIVEKCLAPGVSVSAIALAHGFNTNLVRKWIAKYQARRAPSRAAKLLPVAVIEAPSESETSNGSVVGCAPTSGIPVGSIEIEIGRARVKVFGRVDGEQLRVVLEALGAGR